jgi:hypothetical protein
MPQNAALSRRKLPYNSILVLKFQHCATLLAHEGVEPRELWVVMIVRTAMMPNIVGVTEPQRAVALNGNASHVMSLGNSTLLWRKAATITVSFHSTPRLLIARKWKLT